MLNFKKLTLEDKKILDSYLKSLKYESCEYSFTTLYIWKDACDVQYAIYNDVLILKKTDFNGLSHFMQPVGYEINDLKQIVNLLKEYKKEHNMNYLFGDVEEQFVDDMKKCFHYELDFEEDRDGFDYVYEGDKLISLSGKKLHAKKNHYNQFIKNYEFTVKDINDVKTEDCIKSLEIWFQQREDKDKYLLYEIDAVRDLLENKDIFDIKGMVVIIDDKICGLTIGEKINEDSALIHVEKADPSIKGLYAFINKTFVEKYFSDVKNINREQDLGIPGLRKAKESYKLFSFVKKFIIR
ncbi:MAG: phosphatidylglycerol lysyltransferase domain-containing protein [Clostridium sp.]|nr:phosphatidylglycerol lysyltransferase domain-containing protein [Clostridium sp.]